MAEDSPTEGASVRRPSTTKEAQVVTALDDKRLRGHEDAIYFLLRGLGMEVIEAPAPKKKKGGANQGDGDQGGPNKKDLPLPRIEVSAAQNPILYAALRRLGIQPQDGRIFIEPRESAEAGTLGVADQPASPDTMASPVLMGFPADSGIGAEDWPDLPPNVAANHGFVKSKDARTLSRPYRVAPRRPKISAEELEALFDRLKRHKHSQHKEHIVTAVAECGVEIQIETEEAERRARIEAERAAKFAAEEAARIATGRPPRSPERSPSKQRLPSRSASKAVVPQKKPAKLAANHIVEATGPPDWWCMSYVRKPSREEQEKRCVMMARPLQRRVNTTFPRMAQTVVGPLATFPKPGPSRKGRAAHRDLCQRLEAVKAMGGYPWQRKSAESLMSQGGGHDSDGIAAGALDATMRSQHGTDNEPFVDWRVPSSRGRLSGHSSKAFEHTLEEVQAMFGGRGCCSTPGGVSDSEASTWSTQDRNLWSSAGSGASYQTGWGQGTLSSLYARRSADRGATMRVGSCPSFALAEGL